MKLALRIAARYIAKRLPKEAEKMLKKVLGVNWRTTLSGVALLLGGGSAIIKCVVDNGITISQVLGFFTGHMDPCLAVGVGMFVSGVGLLHAKDAKVTGAGATATIVEKPPA